MKYIVDAQLPRRIAVWLREAGHDALHTLDLPESNRTTDQSIIALSLREHRVVVTKDADFVAGFVLRNEPERLLLISTGNITNHSSVSSARISARSWRRSKWRASWRSAAQA